MRTVQFCEPTAEFSIALGESGKPGFMVKGSVVTVCNANASINPGLVNVEAAAVIQDDL